MMFIETNRDTKRNHLVTKTDDDDDDGEDMFVTGDTTKD